jgi:hypothetical protein
MAKEVYVAAVGLTKVDLTGRIFGSIFDLFADAYERALADSSVRSFDAVQVGVMDSEEFENRANIADVVVDRLGLTGIPAVRSRPRRRRARRRCTRPTTRSPRARPRACSCSAASA